MLICRLQVVSPRAARRVASCVYRLAPAQGSGEVAPSSCRSYVSIELWHWMNFVSQVKHINTIIIMSSNVGRVAKRVRLTNPVCAACRYSFTSSARPLQQQAQRPASTPPPPPPPQQGQQHDQTTHFGFETVAESIKASRGV